MASSPLVDVERNAQTVQQLEERIRVCDDVLEHLQETLQQVQDNIVCIKKKFSRIPRTIRASSQTGHLQEKLQQARDDVLDIKEKLSETPRTIRVASWNIRRFKARGEVCDEIITRICDTILENDFDVVAIQNVSVYQIETLKTTNCIKKLVAALNAESQDEWKYKISQDLHQEYAAFVWNTGSDPSLNLKCSYVIDLKCNTDEEIDDVQLRMDRACFVGEFRVGEWKFSLVSIHLIKEAIHQGYHVLPIPITTAKDMQEHDVILLGGFCCIPPARVLDKIGYVSLFHREESTNITEGNCSDNILIHSDLRAISYDQHKVANIKGPRSPHLHEDVVIISDHCPIYADFV